MKHYAVLLAVLVSLAPSSAIAEVILSESGEFGPEPSSEPRHLTVDVQETANVAMLATWARYRCGGSSWPSLRPPF